MNLSCVTYTVEDFLAGRSIKHFILLTAADFKLPVALLLQNGISAEKLRDLVAAWRESICDCVFQSLHEPLRQLCDKYREKLSKIRDPDAAQLGYQYNYRWLTHYIESYELVWADDEFQESVRRLAGVARGDGGKPDQVLPQPEEKPEETSPANEEVVDEKIAESSDLVQNLKIDDDDDDVTEEEL